MVKHTFTEILRRKGWSLREIGDRWGMHMQSVGRIARRPSARDMDAVRGLPEKPAPGRE